MKAIRFTLTIMLFNSLLLIHCDAPRKNPLDPGNPDRILLTISGLVQTVSIPYAPIPGARISWQEEQNISFSDGNGSYTIETVKNQNGWLYIDKSGFFHDSVYVNWSGQKNLEIDVFLNSLPVAESLIIYSSVLNRYPNLQSEQLYSEIRISDRDGDIDSVRLYNSYNDFKADLNFNPTSQQYESSFTLSQLQVGRLEELLGYPFDLVVEDKFDHKLVLTRLNLIRVIRDEIFFISPSGNDTSSAEPLLRWQMYTPGFNHTYTLEIFTADIAPQLIWRKEHIPQEMDEYTVDITLDPGEYFWVIWAVDEFRNRVRSKPASFRILP